MGFSKWDTPSALPIIRALADKLADDLGSWAVALSNAVKFINRMRVESNERGCDEVYPLQRTPVNTMMANCQNIVLWSQAAEAVASSNVQAALSRIDEVRCHWLLRPAWYPEM